MGQKPRSKNWEVKLFVKFPEKNEQTWKNSHANLEWSPVESGGKCAESERSKRGIGTRDSSKDEGGD